MAAAPHRPPNDVPVLALGGTLDGRTDIDNQREAVSKLRNVTFVNVHNAGHNLFDERSDGIQAAIDALLEGRSVPQTDITIGLPDMKPAFNTMSHCARRNKLGSNTFSSTWRLETCNPTRGQLPMVSAASRVLFAFAARQTVVCQPDPGFGSWASPAGRRRDG
ncbi:alpha/beta fold hydrolase [Luteimonas sp. R10]|uniref:alpha/beta fold hydrolase n=1 Tax=Luteimonas sp. R10 TaxID=3108176 RepID=UPI003092B8EF|nr:alpha/beta hydrolase [Luteimonas sp. R10]